MNPSGVSPSGVSPSGVNPNESEMIMIALSA